MKFHHRGITLELEDTDPRVRLIEVILFGDPLPPPLPMPVVAVAAPPPAPAPVAKTVPDSVRQHWKRLFPHEQKELLLLSSRAWLAEDLEKALGLSQLELRTIHSRIARLANKHGVPLVVSASGRHRSLRRYFLPDAGADMVQELVAAGLAGTPG